MHVGYRGRVAYLSRWDGEPELIWNGGGLADPSYGSGSRRE